MNQCKATFGKHPKSVVVEPTSRNSNLGQTCAVDVTWECPKCGGPNTPEADLCQWCGSALTAPPSIPAPPPPSPQIIVEQVPVERAESPYWGVRIIIFVVFLIVIIAIIASVASNPPASSGPSVNITGLNVNSPDNACGLSGDDSGTVTLNPPGGAIPFITWGLPGPGGNVPCTVTGVSTNTPGFSLFGSLPYTASSVPSVLIISMTTPSSFQGVLNVTCT